MKNLFFTIAFISIHSFAMSQHFISQGVYLDTLVINDDRSFLYIKGSNWPYESAGARTTGTWEKKSDNQYVLTTFQDRSVDSVLNVREEIRKDLNDSIAVVILNPLGECLLSFNVILFSYEGDTIIPTIENVTTLGNNCDVVMFPRSKIQKILVQKWGVTIDTIYTQNPLTNYFEINVSVDNYGPRYMNKELWIIDGDFIFSAKYPTIKFKAYN